MNIQKIELGWANLLNTVTDSEKAASDLLSEPFEDYLNGKGMEGLDRIQALAVSDYMVAHDAKDKAEKSRVGKAWKICADKLRARCTYRKLTLSYNSLTAIANGEKARGLSILPQAESLALRKVEQDEKTARQNALRETVQQFKAEEEYKAISALTAQNLASDLLAKMAICGATLKDVILYALDEQGPAIRKLGTELSKFESVFEKAEKAERQAQARKARKTVTPLKIAA